MSITVMNNGDGVENGDGCLRGMPCVTVVDEQKNQFHGGDRRIVAGGKVMREERENEGSLSDSCSCSSIGKNSDDNDADNSEDEEEEVQSSYKCKNGSLDALQALEEALPMRRGMSRFYNGKSKSFTSLTDASPSSSINEIAKPENAYSRRRRNLLACSLVGDKNRSFQLKSNGGGGVSKRSGNSSRTTLALAVAMNSSSPSNNDRNNHSNSNANLISRLSPLQPQHGQSHCSGNFSAWRSFSLADLQQCTSLKAPEPR